MLREGRADSPQRDRERSEVLLSIEAPAGLVVLETLDALLHGALAVDFVVAGAYVHSVAGLLLLSNHYIPAEKQKEKT